jgi:hypothetical protein
MDYLIYRLHYLPVLSRRSFDVRQGGCILAIAAILSPPFMASLLR